MGAPEKTGLNPDHRKLSRPIAPKIGNENDSGARPPRPPRRPLCRRLWSRLSFWIKPPLVRLSRRLVIWFLALFLRLALVIWRRLP